MKLAMPGFATVAKHEFITHKYDASGACKERLSAHVGEQQATQIMVEIYTNVIEHEGEQGMQGKSDITVPVPLRHLTTPPMIGGESTVFSSCCDETCMQFFPPSHFPCCGAT